MRVIVFSSKPYDRQFLEAANASFGFELEHLEAHLTPQTAALAEGADAVCVFVNDVVNAQTLQRLAAGGVRLIALRCAGFNNVDLAAAADLKIAVGHVPAYSPHAVAEHTLALVLALDRNIHRAYNRVREGNFSLEGLLGFDLHGKTVGVVGTGSIGKCVVRILRGFGCEVLALDPSRSEECEAMGARYLDQRDELLSLSDIVTLHCPLTDATHHLVDAAAVSLMRRGAMLVNTSRGGLIDTAAVIDGLKRGQIGAMALDVYEEEADLFFEDGSDRAIPDDTFARLLTFPNVLITGHQGFFTREALGAIARTTLDNIAEYGRSGAPRYSIAGDRVKTRTRPD